MPSPITLFVPRALPAITVVAGFALVVPVPRAVGQQDLFAAIAYSPSEDQWSAAWDRATRDEAERDALRECWSFNTKWATKSDCVIVGWVKNGCSAFALGFEETGAASLAADRNRWAAERAALADCRRRNGGADCVRVCWVCNSWGLLDPGDAGGISAKEVQAARAGGVVGSGVGADREDSRSEVTLLEKAVLAGIGSLLASALTDDAPAAPGDLPEEYLVGSYAQYLDAPGETDRLGEECLEQGVASSCALLAYAYERGIGVPQDSSFAIGLYREGASYLKQKCEAGDPDGCNQLWIWARGTSRKHAVAWVAPDWDVKRIAQRACSLGVTSACQN